MAPETPNSDPGLGSDAPSSKQRIAREGGLYIYLSKERDLNPRVVPAPEPAGQPTYYRELDRAEPAEFDPGEPIEPDPSSEHTTDVSSETSILPSVPPSSEEIGRKRVVTPVIQDEDSPEFQKVLKRIRRKKILTGILVAGIGATAVAAIAALGGYAFMENKGLKYADASLEDAHIKTGITLVTKDRDLKGEPIGLVYGSEADPEDIYPDTLNANDRSIPVNPEALANGGSLFYWYQSLMKMEDQGHEGGLSDKIGFDPRGLIRIFTSGFTQGGSNIANQTCKALGTHIPRYEDFAVLDRKGPKARAVHDYACGIGLGTTMEPRDIAALYATYGYMGVKAQGTELFVRMYWDLPNISSPDLTAGHQLIMSSAIKYPWNSQVSFERKQLEGQDDPLVKEEPVATAERAANDPQELERLVKKFGLNKSINEENFEHVEEIIAELTEEHPDLHKSLQDNRFQQLHKTDTESAHIYLARKFYVYMEILERIQNDDELWDFISNRAKNKGANKIINDPELQVKLFHDLEIVEIPNSESRREALNELAKDPELYELLNDKTVKQLAEVDQLAANILLTKKYEALMKLYDQIDKNRPMSDYEARQLHPGLSLQPTGGYAYPRHLALRKAHALFGPEWRTKVQSIVLTIDPNVQYMAAQSAKGKLKQLPAHAGAVVLVANEDGEIVAAYSGDRNGYDDISRLHTMRQPASMGKLLLVHAIDHAGRFRQNPKTLESFRKNLRWSKSDIQNDARLLGAHPDHLRKLIDCFGDPLRFRGKNPFEDATLGVFATNPLLISRLMIDPHYNGPMPDPYVVDKFIMVDGTEISGATLILGDKELNQFGIITPSNPNYEDPNPDKTSIFEQTYSAENRTTTLARLEEIKECHSLVAPHRGSIVSDLIQEPLDGTLDVLDGLADGGKTGTRSVKDKHKKRGQRDFTNVTWTIANMHRPNDPGAHSFVIVVGIGGDNPKQLIGRHPSGGNTAGPVARDVLQVVLQRSKSGHLWVPEGMGN